MAVRKGRDREELERLYRVGGTHRLRQRAQAILLSSRGYRVEALAALFELDPELRSSGCALGKLASTWVRVPPVELDGSRPKAMSGMKPRGRSRKRDIV